MYGFTNSGVRCVNIAANANFVVKSHAPDATGLDTSALPAECHGQVHDDEA
jgi:hypothetical protein